MIEAAIEASIQRAPPWLARTSLAIVNAVRCALPPEMQSVRTAKEQATRSRAISSVPSTPSDAAEGPRRPSRARSAVDATRSIDDRTSASEVETKLRPMARYLFSLSAARAADA